VIKDILQDLAILTENIYNINKTRVMLFMLSSIKVLISKYNKRDYKGARVKRIIIIIIESISGNNKYLNLIII
jgi:hypothetical protein